MKGCSITKAICTSICVSLFTLGIASAQEGALDEMQALLDGGFYASAAQVVGPELVRALPDEADAHFLYARALYLMGDVDAAQASLTRATELAGDEAKPSYMHLQGLLSAAAGDLAGATEELRDAFRRSRRYEIAMDWGRVAWQRGDVDTALEAFDAAAETEEGRKSPWPPLNRGRLLLYEGRTEEAVTAFERAITVFEENDTGEGLPSPAYVEAFYRLGEAFERLGDEARAETNYLAARSVDPGYTPATEALMRLGASE